MYLLTEKYVEAMAHYHRKLAGAGLTYCEIEVWFDESGTLWMEAMGRNDYGDEIYSSGPRHGTSRAIRNFGIWQVIEEGLRILRKDIEAMLIMKHLDDKLSDKISANKADTV